MIIKRPQIDTCRVLFWVLAFLGFAIVSYVYHWWSGDARNASIFAMRNFEMFIGLRVTRTLLEMMLISLFVLLVSGWLKFSNQTRVRLQSALKTYGVFLLIVLNPPILATTAWFSNSFDLEHGWFVVVFIVLIEIILELVIIFRLRRVIFAFLSSLFSSLPVLPATFWGLWFGFVLWSFQPAITLRCSDKPNLKIPTSQLARQIFQRWVNRIDPIAQVASLPPVDYIRALKAITPNEFEDACQEKQAFDFLAAHHVLLLELSFYGKDKLAYKAKINSTISENLELQVLGVWQVQKDKLAKPNPLIGRKRQQGGTLGNIRPVLEKLYEVIPALRQSLCVGFTQQNDLLKTPDLAQIVADFDGSSTLNNLYLVRSGKLERSWDQMQIRASFERVAKRLGYGTVQNWNVQRVYDNGLFSCSSGKPYYGSQMLEERYFAFIPQVEVAAGSKTFNVFLSVLTRGTPRLEISFLREKKPYWETRTYDFLPSKDDIPWSLVSVNDLEYNGSPLLSRKIIK
jgi:hypothetical protein